MKKLISFSLLLLALLLNVNALTIVKQSGWFESAYITWEPVTDATSYNVYYSGEGITNRQIDSPLIRQYENYFRADALGLKAGTYTITVKAVNATGVEFESATSATLTARAHYREGYAFANNILPGAYNADGTIKAGARIIYITAANANTVSCDVNDSKGVATTYTGLSNILNAYGKGYDKTPLIVRMIGLVKNTQIDGLKDGNFISLTGSNNTARLIENITIEGVGHDATAHGYDWNIRH